MIRSRASHLLKPFGRIRTPISGCQSLAAIAGGYPPFAMRLYLSHRVRVFNPLAFQGTKEEFGLQYFTEPNIHFPTHDTDGPSLQPLLRWLRGDTQSDVNVAVILAPAAFGKTTLSEALFLSLLGYKNIVLVLIKQYQWIEFAARESIGMIDIWESGVRKWYPQALIGPDKLDTFLRTGVICPVFDGLDELCSFFPTDFNPTETVEELISSLSEARVVITSRTQFWDESISPGAKKKVLEIELKPFTLEQREQYLGVLLRKN